MNKSTLPINHPALILSLLLIALFGIIAVASAIEDGHSDDFEDGTSQSWETGRDNDPINQTTGGPAGVDDNYLQNSSTGGNGSNSKLVMFNQSGNWTGDYVAAGITQIEMDLRNVGENDLQIRIALQGTNDTRYATINAFALPADNQWHHATFLIDATSLTRVGGTDDLATALTDVTTFRILHSDEPAWRGTAIEATVGFDNIEAGQTPELNFKTYLPIIIR